MTTSRRFLPVQQVIYGNTERCSDSGQPRKIGTGNAVFPVRHGGLVDTDDASKLFLAHVLALSQGRDASVDRPVKPTSPMFPLHATTVD